MAGIVVGVAGPNVAIVGDLVPFLARDLASLATDADGWISEEANRCAFFDIGMAPLVRALNAFADHCESVFPC